MDPLLKKLQFKNQETILVLNAPDEFKATLHEWKDFAQVLTQILENQDFSFVLVFTEMQRHIREAMDGLTGHLEEDTLLWIAYPKKSSKKYKSNISRMDGWQPLGEKDYEPVRQIAIDSDWSALRFKPVGEIKTMTRSFALSEKGRERIDKEK